MKINYIYVYRSIKLIHVFRFPCTKPDRNINSQNKHYKINIPLKNKCDGIADCPLGIDEMNCGKSHFYCKSGSFKINKLLCVFNLINT